jgi:acyl-CoA reductase-like NAD-dependent aldehyde dehydrogenase
MIGYWVHFDNEGRASHFSGIPFKDAEWVEGVDDKTLITHKRVEGEWVIREPVVSVAQKDESSLQAAREAAEQNRDSILRLTLAAEADPLFFKWQRGEATKEEWLAKVEEIKARCPKPENTVL